MSKKITLLAFMTFFVCSFFISTNAQASTNLSGSILKNTTLLSSESPYIITDHLIIFPDITLTIEPSVELRFALNTKLEIRGNLVAEGTADQRIIFTSNESSPAKNSWSGIKIATNQGGKASLKFVDITNAGTGLSVDCCWNGGPVSMTDSRFINNNTAVGGYAGWDITIERTTFENNTNTITSADKVIRDCTFTNNTYGLYQTERVDVYDSTFTGHTIALWGGRGIVKNNTITNNQTGVKAFFEGFTASYNTIANNNTGVVLGSYGSSTPNLNYNNIYNNTTRNIEHTGATSADVSHNYWGKIDTDEIQTSLYDGRDNANLGLLTYQPFFANLIDITEVSPLPPEVGITEPEPNENQQDSTLSGSIFNSTTLTLANSPYTVTGDVTLFPGATLTINPDVELRFDPGTKLTIRGNLYAEGKTDHLITFTSNKTSSSKGDWQGINIATNQGGKAFLEYATISYASTGLSVDCCNLGGPVTIHNSTFSNNTTALGGYAGWDIEVENTTFENNTYAATNADKVFRNCTFTNNTYGLYQTERVDVYDSTFTGHTVALWGGRGKLEGNTISHNGTGIKAFFEGFEPSYNSIYSNEIGISLGSYSNSTPKVNYNNIYKNASHNIQHTGSTTVDAGNNYWGITDTDKIQESIYDGRDSSSLGLITYQPMFTEIIDITKSSPLPPAIGITEPQPNGNQQSSTLSGSIFNNTTLTLTQSPYTVTDNVTVFPNVSLTIEPGVEILFLKNTSLEIRGSLVAEGLTNKNITFTAKGAIKKGDWQGIKIATNQGGKAFLEYTTISYASTGLSVDCCNLGGPVTIHNSTFSNNTTALGGYAGWDIEVENTTFENNTYAATNADKVFRNCTFTNNTYGLYQTERVDVYDSTFTGHTVALWGGRGTVQNSMINHNNTGIQGFFEGFNMSYNTISDNSIGIILGSYSNSTPAFHNNNIYKNTTYNIKHTSANTVDATYNYWGTNNNSEIKSLIYDGLDNASLGLVNYLPTLNNLPDLTVEDVKLIFNGSLQMYFIQAKICNRGQGTVLGKILYTEFIRENGTFSKNAQDLVSLNGLAVDTCYDASVTIDSLNIDQADDYTITVIADCENNITESNENNNSLITKLSINPAHPPIITPPQPVTSPTTEIPITRPQPESTPTATPATTPILQETTKKETTTNQLKSEKELSVPTVSTPSASSTPEKIATPLEPTQKLLKTTDSSAVYLVNETTKEKRYFHNEDGFKKYGYSFQQIETVDKEKLALYEAKKPIFYPKNHLVKFVTDPKVYLVTDDNSISWIVSEEAFKKHDFKWNEIKDLSDSFYGAFSITKDNITAETSI